MFEGARAKLTIGSLDDLQLKVVAQYNPKELQLTRHVPWAKHDVFSDPDTARADARAHRGQIHFEFTGAEARTLSLELLFDGFETKTSVEATVERLEQLASPRDPLSSRGQERCPHRCVVVWGERKKFCCVIDSVATTYTMFATDGTPLRAVCSVKLLEADVVSTSTSEREQFTGVREVKQQHQR